MPGRVKSAVVVALLAAACGDGGSLPVSDEPAPQTPAVATAPRVDGVVPNRVAPDAEELVTIHGARFCERALVRLANEPVPLETKSEREITFRTKALGAVHELTRQDVAVVCESGTATLPGGLTRDPALIVEPELLQYGPQGSAVEPTAGLSVTFNRPMDPSTVDAARLGIEGVAGRVSWNGATRTAAFAPEAPLVGGRSYVGYVVGGPHGVRSSVGDPLSGDVRWLFRVCLGCGGSTP